MSFSPHVIPPKYITDTSNEKIGTYSRKTYDVEAVQVTAGNMQEVAKWCGGVLKWDHDENDMRNVDYVEIPVSNTSKPSRANIKDWVLKIPNAGKSRKDVFAIYNEYAFGRAFDRKLSSSEKTVAEVLDEALAEAVVKPLTQREVKKVVGFWTGDGTAVGEVVQTPILLEEANTKTEDKSAAEKHEDFELRLKAAIDEGLTNLFELNTLRKENARLREAWNS